MLSTKGAHTIRSWLASLVPELCPRCHGPTARGFCAACARDFGRVADPCLVCGLPRPVASCPRRAGGWHVDALIAPYLYSAPLDRQVQALKFGGVRALGRALGLLLAAELERRHVAADALIPVPLHRARLRTRGYNQAAEIARMLAAELEMPLHMHGIRRVRASAAQTTLELADRRANVAGAFIVERSFAGLRVALVDDVITTGATVNALAAVVRSAGASTVSAWAIARTPELARGGTHDRAACSDAVEIVENDSAKHGCAEPGVVEERPKTTLGRARPDQNLLINAEGRRGTEPRVVPNPELRAATHEHEASEQ